MSIAEITTPRIIQHASRESWLLHRPSTLNGSELAAALGQSPWQSLFALWSEKVSGIREEIDSEAAEWGTILEGPVLEAYARKSGRKVERWNQLNTVVSPRYDWLRCTPDATQIDDDKGPGTVQIKTTSAYLARDWKDDPPMHVQIQAQFEAWMMGMSYGTVAALIGGQKLVWHDFDVNMRFINAALKKLAEFWQCVQDQTPPEVDGSESTTNAIKRMYPIDEGGEIELNDEHQKLVQRKARLAERAKRLDAVKNEVDNRLKVALGDYTTGILPSGQRVTYKAQTMPERTLAASTFRVLRISKLKGE